MCILLVFLHISDLTSQTLNVKSVLCLEILWKDCPQNLSRTLIQFLWPQSISSYIWISKSSYSHILIQNLKVFANVYRIGQYQTLSSTLSVTCEMRDSANLTFPFFVSFLQEGAKKAFFLLQIYIAILTR